MYAITPENFKYSAESNWTWSEYETCRCIENLKNFSTVIAAGV